MSTASSTAFVPALKPPSGVTPDFEASNPLEFWNMSVAKLKHGIGAALIVPSIVGISIPTILFVTRLGVRFFIQRKTRSLEDLLCLVAWALFLTYAAIVARLVNSGGGKHQWNVTHEDAKKILYWVNIGQIVYSMSILTAKLSVLYLYIKIFVPTRWTARWWVVIGIMIANALFYTALMGAKIGQCRPREAIWDKTIAGASCVSLEVVLDTSGSWNVASDVAILTCPLLFIWRLQLTREKKLGIIAFFLVGVIAPIFSVIGVVYRVQIDTSPDYTFYQPRILFFAQAEITTGIICTCLPCLPGLYRWLRGRKGSNAARSGEPNTTYYRNDRRRRTAGLNPHSDTKDLNSQYIELNDGPASGEAVHWANATMNDDANANPRGGGGIWKTTEIRIHTEAVEHSDSENSRDITHLPTTAPPSRECDH